MSERFVLITGCSGGGKSTLLEALRRRGHTVVEEPGRRIVRQEPETGGRTLPWRDPEAFARRAIAMALADRDTVRDVDGWVFFDRGLIDAASAMETITGEPILADLADRHRYHRRVFLAPPWPEIYRQDPERQHRLDDALPEYRRLESALPRLGYVAIPLPKIAVEARADFVLATLAS